MVRTCGYYIIIFLLVPCIILDSRSGFMLFKLHGNYSVWQKNDLSKNRTWYGGVRVDQASNFIIGKNVEVGHFHPGDYVFTRKP